jgi:hypothetical protein
MARRPTGQILTAEDQRRGTTLREKAEKAEEPER